MSTQRRFCVGKKGSCVNAEIPRMYDFIKNAPPKAANFKTQFTGSCLLPITVCLYPTPFCHVFVGKCCKPRTKT